MALSGEDLARRQAWLASVGTWHTELRAYFAAQRAHGGKPVLDQMPTFPPYVAAADGLGGRLAMDLVTLLIWTFLALGVAARGLRRELGRLA